MMKKLLLYFTPFNGMPQVVFLLMLLMLSVRVSAQQLTACRDSVKDGYDFWLYTPQNNDTMPELKPLVMFLHGQSLCGKNLSKVLQYGTIDALTKGRRIDAIVVAPQTQGPWKPARLNNIYEWVKTRYPVDTNRFYVLGMSLGGYGTLDFTASYPDKIAAAVAMCGGATVNDLCGLNIVPLRIVHGTADKAVPVGCSDRVVAEMADCGDTSRLVYDRLPKINHSQLARLFYMDSTYDWLFAHSLTDSLRTINNHCVISAATMKTSYANLDTHYKLKVIDKKPVKMQGKNNNKAASDHNQPVVDDDDSEAVYYVIKKGDTLSAIASRNKTTVDKLCKLNRMNKSAVLQIGRKIRIK